MRFCLIPLAAAAALSLTVASGAVELRTEPKAVLELFTSQGCSSCPKADALLAKLGERDDLITLAYHVDYWDYIGWSETFGTRANSDFQRAYAESWGDSKIYTPQLVVNGLDAVVGSHEDEVTAAIGAAALPLPVSLSSDGKMLDLSIAGRAGARPATVWLVTLIDRASVAIEAGENAGKTIDYTQIVTGRHVLGMWEPVGGAHLKLPLADLVPEGSNGAVILVQEERDGLPGAIVAAASVQL